MGSNLRPRIPRILRSITHSGRKSTNSVLFALRFYSENRARERAVAIGASLTSTIFPTKSSSRKSSADRAADHRADALPEPETAHHRGKSRKFHGADLGASEASRRSAALRAPGGPDD